MRGSVGERLKQVMRAFPQGVTVVTTSLRGRPFGVTVSAFSSISLDPPLVMVSVAKGTRAHGHLMRAGLFAVNILASDQADVSDRFAGRFRGRPGGRSHFAGGSDDCPVLKSCLGYLVCSREAVHDAGDHTIIVGRVVRGTLRRRAPPLVYYNQHYASVGRRFLSPPRPSGL